MPTRQQWPLQSERHCPGIACDQRGVGGIAFIAAAPAHVLRNGEGGGEGPLDPAGRYFIGGGRPDPLDQRRVMRGAKADIVREDRRAGQVGVAVDRVDPEQDRDTRRLAVRAILADELGPAPAGRALVAERAAVAPRQDRPERVAVEIFGCDRADVGLDRLPDLLLDGHAGDHPVDAGLGRRVADCGGAMRPGPAHGMRRR